MVSDPERDKVMVQELLELKSKMDDIVTNAFQSHIKFYDMLRESFESIINRRKNKPAELIGVYNYTLPELGRGANFEFLSWRGPILS